WQHGEENNQSDQPIVNFAPTLKPPFGECVLNRPVVFVGSHFAGKKIRQLFCVRAGVHMAQVEFVKTKLNEELERKEREKNRKDQLFHSQRRGIGWQIWQQRNRLTALPARSLRACYKQKPACHRSRRLRLCRHLPIYRTVSRRRAHV